MMRDELGDLLAGEAAQEWLSALLDSDDVVVLTAPLQTYLAAPVVTTAPGGSRRSAGPSSRSRDLLVIAAVAAAVVAAAVAGVHDDLPPGVAAWVRQHAATIPAAIRENARRAIRRAQREMVFYGDRIAVTAVQLDAIEAHLITQAPFREPDPRPPARPLQSQAAASLPSLLDTDPDNTITNDMPAAAGRSPARGTTKGARAGASRPGRAAGPAGTAPALWDAPDVAGDDRNAPAAAVPVEGAATEANSQLAFAFYRALTGVPGGVKALEVKSDGKPRTPRKRRPHLPAAGGSLFDGIVRDDE